MAAEGIDVVSLSGDKPVGFLVDKIGDVISVPPDEMDAPPQHLDETKASYFAGVARLDGELLMVLDTKALLNDSETELTLR